ncbi:MAG: nitrogen fixation protein FixP [Bdellovibrio sp. CG10_big_fil_rev_8_21_14_0_10_47_8]|nr:MAG: nitrogen fixation protein FixP [Bdellovibrio sp. CG10_big_fil_rev_8_21_14_0_10_47_8]
MSSDDKHQQDESLLLNHDYDGIQEYDNPLPSWWLITFFGTIIFAFLYYIHYTFGGGPTSLDELQVAMAELPKVEQAQLSESTLEAKMAEPGRVASGKVIFADKCSVCHAPEGQGLIGPNLADAYWLHGKGRRADIVQTIAQGVVEKGMPAWATMISEDDLINVASFVVLLKGTHPSNPKPPQGDEVKE